MPGLPPPPSPPPYDCGAPTRDTILATIQRNEGVSKTELMNRLGLGWGTICYHIARLERDGTVQTLRRGRNTLVFPRSRSRQHMEVVAACRRPAVRRVLGLLRERTELTIPGVMEGARLSRYVATSCLADLEDTGLVVRIGKGHARYRSAESVGTLEHALPRLAPSPLAAASNA